MRVALQKMLFVVHSSLAKRYILYGEHALQLKDASFDLQLIYPLLVRKNLSSHMGTFQTQLFS